MIFINNVKLWVCKSIIRMFILTIIPAVLLGCLFNEERSARGSVVENEIVGSLKTSDGAPSVGARVQLFPADSKDNLPKKPVSEAMTNAKGEFHFPKIKAGVYSLLGQHDTLLVFHDSIEVHDSTATTHKVQNLDPDTLRATGTIKVRISLKPGDDLTSISGLVLGTNFGAQAHNDGDLSMVGMPSGRLRIRFTSSLPGYKPLEVTVNLSPGQTQDAGTLDLPF